MSSIERFQPFITGPPAQKWPHRSIYMINRKRGDLSWGLMMFYINRSKDIQRDHTGRVCDVFGITPSYYYDDEPSFKVGIYPSDVFLNYTSYIRMKCAAMRIQRTWRRIRKQKALDVIITAWRNYLVKKNELWNLRCFVGVAYLHIEAVRASREAVGVM